MTSSLARVDVDARIMSFERPRFKQPFPDAILPAWSFAPVVTEWSKEPILVSGQVVKRTNPLPMQVVNEWVQLKN